MFFNRFLFVYLFYLLSLILYARSPCTILRITVCIQFKSKRLIHITVRCCRLTPAYMLVIMVYVPLFRYWGKGPQWPQNGIEYTDCDHWWTNLLYINNLVEPLKIVRYLFIYLLTYLLTYLIIHSFYLLVCLCVCLFVCFIIYNFIYAYIQLPITLSCVYLRY